MGRGKFKGKRTGRRHFSTPQQILENASTRPHTFKQELAKLEVEEESEEETVTEESQKRKGVQGLIEIENPNLVKPKSLKAGENDIGRPTELSRREREEIKKKEAHERYLRLQEQGKTEQSKKDLERLALIRAQRAEAARKREEEKAAKERIKSESREKSEVCN